MAVQSIFAELSMNIVSGPVFLFVSVMANISYSLTHLGRGNLSGRITYRYNYGSLFD